MSGTLSPLATRALPGLVLITPPGAPRTVGPVGRYALKLYPRLGAVICLTQFYLPRLTP